jgi:multiple sugar transport system ATP-binding protein
MSQVRFDAVSKVFGGTAALTNLSLEVADGELLVLLGPSGCGKTTALRLLAGLEEVSSGTIHIDDVEVTHLEPKDRDSAMVFQSYALYPHMSVRKNVEFPLKNAKLSSAEMDVRVNDALATVSLTELADRKPGQLSGGQRQRVALARAIVRRPRVFLMDEPLSNLDATLRQQSRADIVALQRRLGVTTVYVTHDQVEAMTMGHRIAVMKGGVLQQVGRPLDLYNEPANAFVAGFLGSPGMNLVAGRFREGHIYVGDDIVGESLISGSGDVTVGMRAENLHISAQGFSATVVVAEELGADVHVVCETASKERVVVRQPQNAAVPQAGQSVSITATGQVCLFDRVTGERLS